MKAAWKGRAACRGGDPDLFFPVGHSEAFAVEIEKAKAICRQCPVRSECLTDALNGPEKYGIWGGLTEEERAKQRRRNRRTAPRRQEVKECARCLIVKPVGKFFQRPEREGGRDAYCRPCCAERARERRAAKKGVAAVAEEEVVARLERERVRDPEALEAERYAPVSAERGYWNRPATNEHEERAARNRACPAASIKEDS